MGLIIGGGQVVNAFLVRSRRPTESFIAGAMNQTFLVGAYAVSFGEALATAAGVIALLLLCLIVGLARSRALRLRERAAAEERQHELEQRMAELARASAELNGRLQSMAETFGSRQADL